MNDAWTSSNASWENKSPVNVKSGGRGENELCGWQLSFTLYSLENLPCVLALCFPPSRSLCASPFVRAEKLSLIMFLVHDSRTSEKNPLWCDFVTSSLNLFPPDLIHCTNDVNVNIPHLADTLFERTANSSWVVVFKALITTHHLMMYGNEVGSFFTKNSQTNQKKPQANDPSKAVSKSGVVRLYYQAGRPRSPHT